MKNRSAALLAIFCFAILAIFSTISHAQPGKDYQLIRQAEQLVRILGEANSIDDPAMRALIRFECLSTIYAQTFPDLHARTDAEVLKFYSELSPGRELLRSYRVNDWQNALLKALRLNRPELANQVETTYLGNVDISAADQSEMSAGGKVQKVVDRTIDRLRLDVVVRNLESIESAARAKAPAEADRLVIAAFEASERSLTTHQPIFTLIWQKPPAFFAAWSPVLRTRYLARVISLARSNVGRSDSEQVKNLARSALNRNWEYFKLYAPQMVVEAEALSGPTSLRSMGEPTASRVTDRSEASGDIVKELLAKADAVANPGSKFYYLSSAIGYAAAAKQYRRAIEIAEAARQFQPASEDVDRDLWLRVFRPALDHSGVDAASAIVPKINSNVLRAAAMAELARALAQSKRKEEAVSLIQQALKLLENAGASTVPASELYRLVDPALMTESGEGFGAARLAIAFANRLPEPRLEERVGGSSHSSYAERVLVLGAISIANSFNWMASRDLAAAESCEREIKYTPWKLMARIAIERDRPYPMPQSSSPVTR